MKSKIRYHSFSSYIIVSLIGCFLHFAYQLSGNNIVAAAFFPTDESPFQHMKLLFFPFAVYTFLRFFFKKKDMIFSSAIGILLGMITTLAVFYTYSGIIGQNFAPVDIASFFIGMYAAFKFSDNIQKKTITDKTKRISGFVIFFSVALMLIIFTYFTPDLAVFTVPN